jgi:hypothetical protein
MHCNKTFENRTYHYIAWKWSYFGITRLIQRHGRR